MTPQDKKELKFILKSFVVALGIIAIIGFLIIIIFT